MPTTLAANFRVDINYSINGITHVWRGYCDVIDPTTDPIELVGRPGRTPGDWRDVAQASWDTMRAIFQDTATGGVSATLLQRDDTVWNPIDFVTLTGAGSSSSATKPAQQLTYVLRDTSLKKIRWILMETVQNYVGHFGNGTGGGTAQDTITATLNAAGSTDTDFYSWQKSRGNFFFAASGTVAGLTYDLNDKLKRSRNLE